MTNKNSGARYRAIVEAEGAVNVFSNCDVGLTPCGGFSHPLVTTR